MHWNYGIMAHLSMINMAKSPVLLSNNNTVGVAFLVLPNVNWNVSESYSWIETDVNESCDGFPSLISEIQLLIRQMLCAGWIAAS